jgi:excisionase family DNA binding protein
MQDEINKLLSMVSTLSTSIDDLRIEVSTLSRKVQNPEYIKYTVDEACDRMKVSRQTFYRRVGDGVLDVFKEGGRTYTTEANVLRYERTMRS